MRMAVRRFVAMVMAGAVVVSATSASAQTNPAQPSARLSPAQRLAADLAELRKHEGRVAVIGERLSAAAAAAGWCTGGQSMGWTLGEVGQYPKNARLAVLREWQLPPSTALFVSSVVPDGPAARAGIVPGMSITMLAGRTPMRNSYDMASRHALAASERLIDERLAAGPLAFDTLARDGTRRTWSIAPQATCDTRFEVAAEDEQQAYADGDTVQVTAGMAKFTENSDDELAAVLAHELSHNILRHVARTRDADLPNNYTRYLGRYTRITRSMEEEADRLSVWLLAAAGYNPDAPLGFWQRFGPDNDSSHPFGRTHDRWEDRVAALTDELARMRAAKATDPAARPALLDRAEAIPDPSSPRPSIGTAPRQ
jgi:beta-barrel assembly-enhancing protease